MSNVEKYADKAMFEAEPMPRDENGQVTPQVYLLWMTPDPLGAIAAACRMYEGKVTRSLSEVTDEERQHYAAQVQKTHLKAPLEFVKFHFFIEGVDRSFTHQIVRQRTAVYAQESLRFAVKEDMADEALIPPSIQAAHVNVRTAWKEHMEVTGDFYNYLVANGVPAEDARGILPGVTSTRLHYCTDLRNLADHSGNRLCTQAQFIWRKVFLEIVKAINQVAPELTALNLFKPVCYQLGHCPFTASFDRGCTIRDRVEANAKIGRPSSEWHKSTGVVGDGVAAIHPREWADDPEAGFVR